MDHLSQLHPAKETGDSTHLNPNYISIAFVLLLVLSGADSAKPESS